MVFRDAPLDRGCFRYAIPYSLLLFLYFVSVSGIAMMMINHILPIHGEI
jgi:hypothetical protein